MKKYICIFLTLILLASLCSCGAKEAEVNENDGKESLSSATESTAETEASVPVQAEGEKPPVGGSRMCRVHYESFHSIPSCLSEYVGEDIAQKWFKENNAYVEGDENNDCISAFSICNFIEAFNIPKETFISLYNNGYDNMYYFYDYDIDLMYSGDDEAIDKYYRDKNARDIHVKKGAHYYNLKTNIIPLEEYAEKYPDSYALQVSLAELVYESKMTKEELLNTIGLCSSTSPDEPYFDYNVDILFDNEEYIKEMMKEHSAYYIDCLFCGIEPTENPYTPR